VDISTWPNAVRAGGVTIAQDGWQELNVSSRKSSEMARNWRALRPAVDCSELMIMMMMMMVVVVVMIMIMMMMMM
jgi:hypothetical protein